ncbi:MAG: DUF2461 domain-containing protein [Acidimicrobiales bacterium]
MAFTGFGRGAVGFYEELEVNNDRDWWRANKDRYERDVRMPLELLLEEVAAEFGDGKVFRPYRDVRFSADKTPYKLGAGAIVGNHHYVEVSAAGLRVGGGDWHPERDRLARLRAAILDDRTGSELASIVDDLRGRQAEIASFDAVKTAPRGVPPDHPRIDLLRMKGLAALWLHPPGAWLSTAKARDRVVEGWRALRPLVRWLDTG